MTEATPRETGELLCPASEYRDPLQDGTIVAFGDIVGTPEAPRVDYYPEAIPITPEIAEAWAQGPINPGEIVRTAGRCKEGACRHWTGHECSLFGRWIAALPDPDDPSLPKCSIRVPHPSNGYRRCRGWAQWGPEACRKCSSFAGETVWMKDNPFAPVTDQTKKHYL